MREKNSSSQETGSSHQVRLQTHPSSMLAPRLLASKPRPAATLGIWPAATVRTWQQPVNGNSPSSRPPAALQAPPLS
jgi:hypothetical protein